ncbi:hypothetical protein AAFF_G00342860 [Aldrovandia affinis]|uniref:Uncharacterized protein n=1 Tax=Aldrovandia affinis TaxID=143900 RepID=A0AAD7SJU6_9TELE|nr:hypothetical protein AAFF_G00342860 [Aldrovandia affinis]
MEAQSEEKVPGDAASSLPAIHTVHTTSADPQMDVEYTAKTPSPTVAAKDQDLIITRNFSFSYQQDAGPAKRRIRICCNELNILVPFCNRHTDKAFLKYIKEIYGNSLKMEFQNTFCGKTGKHIKLTEVDEQFSSQRETVNPPCIVPADHS